MTLHCRLLLGGLTMGFTGLVSAAPPEPRPPATGVTVNGTAVYVAPVDKLNLDPHALTVSAWVKLDELRTSQVFVNVGEVNTGFTLYLYKNQVRMLVGYMPFGYAYSEGKPPVVKEWSHFAGTYDGKTIRLYHNGKQASELKIPGRVVDLAGKLYVGALNEHDRPMHGQIDDVRIWRRVLTDAEILAVAAGQTTAGLERELAGRWSRAESKEDRFEVEPASAPALERTRMAPPLTLRNEPADGYRGIWYMNQPSNDEYKYKYSGGMATYCANHIPLAWYVPAVKKTFFVYGGTTKDSYQHLVHMVSYYDHETGLVPRPTLLLDKNTSDAHDNPSMNVDDQGYIWIFSASHGQARPSCISRSKQPYDVSAFEVVWSSNFSYPQAWHLPGQGFLFLHTFYDGGRTICMRTSPDGVNWSDRRLLLKIEEGHYEVSERLGPHKVGTSFMYHPAGKGVNWRTNLYYMETEDFGATWKTADGQPLKIPVTEIHNPALVHDYQADGLLVYIQDVAADPDGRPVILYTTSKGYESGPANDPRTWTTAHWTGTKWEIQGGDITSDNNYDLGSIYIESRDQWRIIGPTRPGPQRYNPGGEVAMWTSQDQGRHWKLERQMTASSELNHSFVRSPVNAHPDFYGYWADGNGRKPSKSHLYFCNQQGDVFRLPVEMTSDFAKPELVPAGATQAAVAP